MAGGQWFPFFVADSRRRTPEFLAQLVAASEFAYRRYQILVGNRYGVRWMRNYPSAMLDDMGTAGASVRVMELPDREAVRELPERVVINCTGLGAKSLFGDDELVLIKGQLTFLLPQPEVDYAVLHGELYMFPRSDGILLGGTHDAGVWTLDVDLAAKQRILAGHGAFFDGFRSC